MHLRTRDVMPLNPIELRYNKIQRAWFHIMFHQNIIIQHVLAAEVFR